ncbi:MAG: hypothetical protein KatS3mg037_1336 [Ignavibacterium sp.]|nr:MAG: hypothetical protein KatS3mg037_1336 [Ignavibacterium sp.]
MTNPALVLNCNNIMSLPIIRLLGKNNIPVDTIFGTRKSKANYQEIIRKSKYIRQTLFFDESDYEKNLINLLINFGENCKLKPVLFLASDTVLNIISSNREQLKSLYYFTLPPDITIKQILRKEEFIDLANFNNLPIPKSIKINDITKAFDQIKDLEFPVIIKPSWRTNDWLEKFKEKKVFRIYSRNDLESAVEQIKEFDTNYLIQEIIPGSEDQIFCSFAVLDHNSEPIEVGFCRKLTQFPPNFGNTSVAIPIYDERLKHLSEMIFKKLKLVGYASIEFKLDPRDNKFKIIEITPNRFNRQFAVTYLNKLNLPLQLYRFELNLPPQKIEYKFSKNLWMSETNEIRRIKSLNNNKLKELSLLFQRIFRTRFFEIFDFRDIKPFFALIKNQFKSIVIK